MILTFDVGATHTRMAMSEDGSELLDVVRMDTDPSPDGVSSLVKMMRNLAGETQIDFAIGGMPVQINDEGNIAMATNLPAWNGLNPAKLIGEALQCETLIANDVTMCGLGEVHAGAEGVRGVVVYVTVSTGVNAVRIVDGEVDESITHYEIGKQLVPDPQGKLVALEELTGGAAFGRSHGKDPGLVRDKRVWRAKERHLSRGLYNTCLHWTPSVIVFGGSMMRDISITRLQKELSRLPKLFDGIPELRPGKLGDTGGLMGSLVRYRQLNNLA